MSKAKAKQTLEDLGLAPAYEIWESYASGGEIPGGEEAIIFDIVARLVTRNRITPKQEDFIRNLLVRLEEKAARKEQWDAESSDAEPVPVPSEGERMVVSGEVLTLKWKESFNGSALKMIVRADEGWRVWGTVPSSVRESLQEGDIVRFTATVKPSDNDPKFGFFSRPTKAMIVHSASEE